MTEAALSEVSNGAVWIDANLVSARALDLKAKLLAALDQDEGYRVHAIRSGTGANVSPMS